MAEISTLDALQELHQELIALHEGRSDGAFLYPDNPVVRVFIREYEWFWERKPKNDSSRVAVGGGKVTIDGDEYSLNELFRQAVLQLSDEADIDEIVAARCLLEAADDPTVLGRPLVECGIIRYHRQRNYVLECARLFLELHALDDEDDEAESPVNHRTGLVDYAREVIFRSVPTQFVPRCMSAMQYIKSWLQRVVDRMTAASVIAGVNLGPVSEEWETIEFSRVSLVQQHELLGVILCRSVEENQANMSDFGAFLEVLKKTDKYDQLLVHLFPALGAYVAKFGSTEGQNDIGRARELNDLICQTSDDHSWSLVYLHSAVRAWWLAEYGGFYLDDPQLPGVDIDEEDRQRTKLFMESLKDGAFDFILAVAADVKSPEWQDPTRIGIRQWLQRKSPPLISDTVPFSDFFQLKLMMQLEVFVDAFISNLPDVLRKLRVEEDEQRQLSQAHEQDLDLERFLIIISYAYEGRPDAAMNFWQDPDSNLAGFMQWASRRASTPLVSAFCEMLQAISENEECATFAHEFLQDEGHHASGKLRRSQSLTWTQIFKELVFFSNKIREKPAPSQTLMYRTGKPSMEQAESEPESPMMLECYLRLITKLSAESEAARLFLLMNQSFNLVELLYQLASCKVPPRLRACTFSALRSLVTRRSQEESNLMWACLDSYFAGSYIPGTTSHHRVTATQQTAAASMEGIFEEIGRGYAEPNAFIQLLITLVSPADGANELHDSLPFAENLGSSSRMPGIEPYVDFVLGHVFARTSIEVQDLNQQRTLRLSCLEFALVCLTTFNEDLIVLGNETNIAVDAAISTTDLATYVRLHPFARVMEWMFNDKVMASLFATVHQDILEVGNSSPDSPIILGILRGVEVISKVMELQATYLDLVRPVIKLQSNQRRLPVSNAAYASFEDGLTGHLNLIVDLGSYCGIGFSELTHACLRLLEKMSSSPKFVSTWSGTGPHKHRNKAIVALEANGEYESISRSLISDISSPLDPSLEAESPTYMTKLYILDFLHSTLQASPNQPTIAHLLLGFKCGVDTLSIIPTGSFAQQKSLFHEIIRLVIEAPIADGQGMRQWLLALKCKSMRILRALWSSPLSAPLVIDELRGNEILFHFLLREVPIQPNLAWEGEDITVPQFAITPGAPTLLDFLALRGMSLEYIALELCNVSQSRLPSVKRRIFEALNGQIVGEGNEPMPVSTIFDLYDFLLPEGIWEFPQPQPMFYKDLSFQVCLEDDGNSNAVYNIDRVKEVLLLKRAEAREENTVITVQDLAVIDREESAILEYLLAFNSRTRVASQSLETLRSWTNLLLVMVESNDFEGTAKISFLLQVLQAILPSLETYGSERPAAALELAKLAKILLYKLDMSTTDPEDKDGPANRNPVSEKLVSDKQVQAVGNLVSDKLFQLFQICLAAISKWAGSGELRAVYYSICYLYLTGMVDRGALISGRQKTTKAIQVYGERLISIICDDAYGSEPTCQTAALILLAALVNTGKHENESHVVEMLNRLNFIGILVDSLRNVMVEWLDIIKSGNTEQQNHHDAKLSLLLQLCQTRQGAKYVLHANLFRAVELSGLFAADPELQLDPARPELLGAYYALLAKVARVIGAAVVSRGAHNVLQGRRFLTDHRMLVSHTLKRSAGIGPVESGLEESIEDLADAFVVIITATGFLDFENDSIAQAKQPSVLFH